ncbi:hypothetical protein KEM48_004453 [Puccinia striiformis f. sp. tritici PST-130]|nr:hypothetical protein KEM48_004453 [Puccinia striiformis f. sp. tritici PST-130]
MTQPPGRLSRPETVAAETEAVNLWLRLEIQQRSITTEKMADDWPFLHLNIISPPAINRLGSNEEQELSLLPFDSSHLEGLVNINFQFDEPPVDSITTTTTNQLIISI